MNLQKVIRNEENRLVAEVEKLQGKLSSLRSASKALNGSRHTRRQLTEAGRMAISRAARKRWAKIRASAKKAA